MTGADDDALLRLDGIHTDIGRYRILHGVNLTARRGRVTALLGRNGAGKTTTLRTIMGLWKARQGRIIFDGQSIAAMDNTTYRPLGHRLRAREHGHLRQIDGAGEHAACHRAQRLRRALSGPRSWKVSRR